MRPYMPKRLSRRWGKKLVSSRVGDDKNLFDGNLIRLDKILDWDRSEVEKIRRLVASETPNGFTWRNVRKWMVGI